MQDNHLRHKPTVKTYTKYILILFTLYNSMLFAWQKSIVLMLDPAGDAQNTGRLIEDSFERGLALQFAEALKAKVETLVTDVRVILTRFPGETLEPLQSAEFSNRMQADLFISLQLYPEPDDAPTLSIFSFSYDPMSALMRRNRGGLKLLPYDQVYQATRATTHTLANIFKAKVESFPHQPFHAINGPHSFPCKPLIGVAAPALAIEIGIANKNGWKAAVPAVANGIKTLIEQCRAQSKEGA